VLVFTEADGRTFLPYATYAYHHPDKCGAGAGFVLSLKRFCLAENEGFCPRSALILDWKVDKALVALEAFIATAASLGIGVLVGALLHDASLGVGVAGGIGTILAFVAFVMAKLSK
jgi:hypothetical protein